MRRRTRKQQGKLIGLLHTNRCSFLNSGFLLLAELLFSLPFDILPMAKQNSPGQAFCSVVMALSYFRAEDQTKFFSPQDGARNINVSWKRTALNQQNGSSSYIDLSRVCSVSHPYLHSSFKPVSTLFNCQDYQKRNPKGLCIGYQEGSAICMLQTRGVKLIFV